MALGNNDLNCKSYDNLLHTKSYYDIQQRSLDANMDQINNNIGNNNTQKEAVRTQLAAQDPASAASMHKPAINKLYE